MAWIDLSTCRKQSDIFGYKAPRSWYHILCEILPVLYYNTYYSHAGILTSCESKDKKCPHFQITTDYCFAIAVNFIQKM